jgi:hypothetical protein
MVVVKAAGAGVGGGGIVVVLTFVLAGIGGDGCWMTG